MNFERKNFVCWLFGLKHFVLNSKTRCPGFSGSSFEFETQELAMHRVCVMAFRAQALSFECDNFECKNF